MIVCFDELSAHCWLSSSAYDDALSAFIHIMYTPLIQSATETDMYMCMAQWPTYICMHTNGPLLGLVTIGP